jgi:hypothetical protein
LSKRRVVRFVVLGTAAVTLAGYSAYAKRANRAFAAEQAISFADDSNQPQISNRAAKTGRLLIKVALADPAAAPAYALASADPETFLQNSANPLIAATPAIPEAATEAEPKMEEPKASESRAVEPKSAAVAPTSPAHEKANDKAKRLPPPPVPAPAPAASNGLLDDGQITGLKGRLRLTSDLAEYWPAVEAALRDVVRTQLRGTKHLAGGKVNIDTNSPEVQKLIWAAVPLLMRLREDQKTDVRKLARVIGLEQVASQI